MTEQPSDPWAVLDTERNAHGDRPIGRVVRNGAGDAVYAYEYFVQDGRLSERMLYRINCSRRPQPYRSSFVYPGESADPAWLQDAATPHPAGPADRDGGV